MEGKEMKKRKVKLSMILLAEQRERQRLYFLKHKEYFRNLFDPVVRKEALGRLKKDRQKQAMGDIDALSEIDFMNL